MATNQESKLVSFRTIAGISAGTFNEAVIAANLANGGTASDYNGALIEFLQDSTPSSKTNINELMNEFAVAQGATNWDSLGEFDLLMDTALLFGREFKVAGDSRTASSSDVSPLATAAIVDRTANYGETSGMIAWAGSLCEGRITFDPNSNYGVGGDDTSELLARITDITDDPAHNVVLLIGANDRGGAAFTLQQSIDNLTDILDALLATSDLHPNGHRVYLCTEMPYESLVGGQLTNHTDFRDYIRTINRPNVHIVETWTAVATSSTNNEFTATYDLDGLHPTPIGFQFAAVPLAEKILLTVPAITGLLASDTATGVLNANYDMAGTGGTVGSSFSGTLATGWVTARNAAYTGIDLQLSKETRADGYVWQRIDLTGTPSADNAFLWIYNTVSPAGFSIGDLYYGAGRIEYEGLVNVVNVTLEMLAVGVTRKSRTLDGYDSTRLIYADSGQEMIQVTPLQGWATGATSARLTLNIKLGTSTDAIAGTIWFRDMTAREASIAPMLITAPAITGTAQVGQTLTCSTGTWQGTQSITYAYQWKAAGVNISGATSSTYLLTSNEAGKTITCTVTATNSVGSNSITSEATAEVLLAPSNVTTPVITGTASVGQTLTSSTGTWNGSSPINYTYQWKRAGVNIVGATNSTYILVAADAANVITVTVTATNSAGNATATSAGTSLVLYPPSNTVAPSISGTAQVGQTLTASNGTWVGAATIIYSYQWKRAGSNIVGATSSTYVPVSADIGNTLTVDVTGTNSDGSATVTSSATSAVIAASQYVTSVKRYEVTIPSSTASATVTVDTMDSRSLIFATFRGTSTTSGPTVAACRIERTNDTTVTLIRQSAGGTPTITAEIEIWYATDSLVESVQYGTIALGTISPPATATTGTTTITSVDTSRTSIMWLGMDSNSGTLSAGRLNSYVTLTNSTTITGVTSNAITGSIGFMAVQWASGAIDSVQNLLDTYTSANTSENKTITSVDVNRSLVFYAGISGLITGSSDLLYTRELTGSTTLTYTRVGTATISRTISTSVVQFKSNVFAANIQRSTINLAGVNSNTATITNVGTSKGFSLFNGWRSAQTNANPSTNWATIELTNGTTVTGTINSTGNTTVIAFEASELK
jgi:hypothetical protein